MNSSSSGRPRESALSMDRRTGPVSRLLGWTIAILVLGGNLVIAETKGPMDKGHWYERHIVGMEVGPTGAQFGGEAKDYGYAAHFNGRDIVRMCVKAHGEYLVVWARDGEYAYYDSKLMPKPPGMGQRDVLRETVDEAAKHDLPVIAYCVVQYGSRALREHPEWRMVGADGKPIDRCCFNTPYREFVKKLLTEMMAYGIDGFHIDMIDQGFGPPYGCWCNWCKEQFQAKHGHPMPKGVTWAEAWDHMLEFRYDTSDRFEKELTDHIRSLDPNTTVDFNYHGSPPFSWEVGQRPVQHASNGDFVTGETGIWGFSALGVGLNARFYAAATPGKPYQVAIQRGVRMYHDQTTRPLNDMRWELLTLLSHGAFVTMVDKTAYDGWLDPVAYERIEAAFEEALAKRAHFGHAPVMDVGIYFSSRTRDWYGREEPGKYYRSFQGAHKGLAREHIPWGVILDENADLETLKRFKVVWLAGTTILSEREVGLLKRYVEGGGQVVITGQTGLFDRFGKPMQESVLSGLIGAKLVERLDSLDNHMRFPKSQAESGAGRDSATRSLAALSEGLRPDWPFLVKGPATVYRPTTARAFGELMKPHRTARQRQGKEGTEWPMSADEPVGPAILVNRIGKGTVVTFACSPDYAVASEHALVEDRLLIRNAIRFLVPEPRVSIEAPAHVEAVVTEEPRARTLRVHLLGYLSPPATTPPKNRPYVLPSLVEDEPCYRARIRLDREIKKVECFGAKTKIEHDNRAITVLVEDIHEVIIIRY